MDYFPAFLDLKNKPVLLVGGGPVAARKARLLSRAGARLTIVAPDLGDELAGLVDRGRASHRNRRFRADDINGHWLVVSATDNPAVDGNVYRLATEQNVFCNAVDDKASCSYITPAIVDRSPLMVAISSGGSAPVLARRVRAKLETLLPQRLGELAAAADRWRDRVKAQLTTFTDRLRFWERYFDAPFDTSQPENPEVRLARLLGDSTVDSAGEAWLVGAGPGDPELLTIRALQCLQAADVILHDRLVSPAILDLARRDAERISVGKTVGCRANSQEEINALLVSLVAEGKRVCRLKGGDPFIFGRGGEEAEALDVAGLSWRVVPGITAAAGCAAATGIPLTHRDAAQSVVLVTAHGKESVDTLDWPSLARDRQTLAVYMGVSRYPVLSGKLIENGRAPDTPIAIIEKGTTPEQRVIRGTLGQLALVAKAHKVQAPAMLIVGEVANRGSARIDASFVATAELAMPAAASA